VDEAGFSSGTKGILKIYLHTTRDKTRKNYAIKGQCWNCSKRWVCPMDV
jgi:hypothetical protein